MELIRPTISGPVELWSEWLGLKLKTRLISIRRNESLGGLLGKQTRLISIRIAFVVVQKLGYGVFRSCP